MTTLLPAHTKQTFATVRSLPNSRKVTFFPHQTQQNGDLIWTANPALSADFDLARMPDHILQGLIRSDTYPCCVLPSVRVYALDKTTNRSYVLARITPRSELKNLLTDEVLVKRSLIHHCCSNRYIQIWMCADMPFRTRDQFITLSKAQYKVLFPHLLNLPNYSVHCIEA